MAGQPEHPFLFFLIWTISEKERIFEIQSSNLPFSHFKEYFELSDFASQEQGEISPLDEICNIFVPALQSKEY